MSRDAPRYFKLLSHCFIRLSFNVICRLRVLILIWWNIRSISTVSPTELEYETRRHLSTSGPLTGISNWLLTVTNASMHLNLFTSCIIPIWEQCRVKAAPYPSFEEPQRFLGAQQATIYINVGQTAVLQSTLLLLLWCWRGSVAFVISDCFVIQTKTRHIRTRRPTEIRTSRNGIETVSSTCNLNQIA